MQPQIGNLFTGAGPSETGAGTVQPGQEVASPHAAAQLADAQELPIATQQPQVPDTRWTDMPWWTYPRSSRITVNTFAASQTQSAMLVVWTPFA